jgi:hypothetical protein
LQMLQHSKKLPVRIQHFNKNSNLCPEELNFFPFSFFFLNIFFSFDIFPFER